MPPPIVQVSRLLTTVDGQQEFRLIATLPNAQNQFIGTCGFKSTKLTASLVSLFVSEQYRRQGIGTLLVRECEKLTTRLGVRGLGLVVNTKVNEKVIPFYQGLGFIPIYTYLDGDLLFWKDVNPHVAEKSTIPETDDSKT